MSKNVISEEELQEWKRRNERVDARGYFTIDEIIQDLQRWQLKLGGETRIKGRLKVYLGAPPDCESWEHVWPFNGKFKVVGERASKS